MKDLPSEQQEIMDVVSLQDAVVPAPSEVYKQAKSKRSKRACAIITFVFLTEFVIAVLFFKQIKLNNIYTRVSRESQNLRTGQIVTAGGVYIGSTEFGLFDGEGTFEFNSGAIYQGDWSEDVISGQGVIQVPSEGTYSGGFRDNEKSGTGTFQWDDGAVYVGEWLHDSMNGQGTYTSQDNVIYEGTFRNNTFSDGTCKFTNRTGEYVLNYTNGEIDEASISYATGITYKGDCSSTGIDGSGTMNYPNGDAYVGKYSNSRRSGKGTYTWSSGDKYDGEWSDDSINGNGTYTFASGNYYSGVFENGTFVEGTYHVEDGFGNYSFTIKNGGPSSVDMTLSDGTKYIGDMTADGKLTGTAQIQYSNGDKYSGKVADGLKTGQGKYSWANGASYDGSWSEDKMNGQGTYMYPSSEKGYQLTGTFSNGVPSGECYYYTTSSVKYKTDWSKGRCIKVYE